MVLLCFFLHEASHNSGKIQKSHTLFALLRQEKQQQNNKQMVLKLEFWKYDFM